MELAMWSIGLNAPIKFGKQKTSKSTFLSTSALIKAAALSAVIGFSAMGTAHAQIVFNGGNSGGTVSGGVDVNGDGVFDDGTWQLVHDPSVSIREVNFPSIGGVAMRYLGDVDADFSVTLNDPDVTFDMALYGSEGLNQSYESAASSYTLSWPAAGTAGIFDPSPFDQLNDAATIVTPNSVTFFQNKPPAEAIARCAFKARVGKDYINKCLEWYVTTPPGTSVLSIVTNGGASQEGYRFGLESYADLIVNKTASSPDLTSGDTGFFTITLENANIAGNSAAIDARLEDLLPAGLTFASASVSSDGPNSGGTYDSSTGEWDIGKVSLGETVSLQINFTIDYGNAGTTITNTIDTSTIVSAQTDLNDNHTSSEASFTITGALPATDDDFTVAPVLAGGTTPSVFDGDEFDGSAATSSTVDVSLTDTGGLTGVTINPDGTINIPTGATPGDYTLTYEICEAGSTTNCSTATVTLTVGAAPSLSMTKVASNAGPYLIGDVVTYTYTVVNDGDQIIRNVAIADTHNGSDPAPTPGNETLLTDAGTQGDSTDAAVDGSWDALAPGDTLTFTGTYTVTAIDAANL